MRGFDELKDALQKEMINLSDEMYMRGFNDCCECIKSGLDAIIKFGDGTKVTVDQIHSFIDDAQKNFKGEK